MTEAPKTINQFGLLDLKGRKFGKLTVLEFNKRLPNGKIEWKCVCDCSPKVLTVRHDYLLHTNSPKTHCGCANKGPSVLRPLEYSVWQMMLKRCDDPTHVAYNSYGGRGIKVCKEWYDFDTFCKDMGVRKSRNMSLERKKVNEGYNKDNCVWLEKRLQGRNRRNTIYIPHPTTGLPVPAAEVAEFLKCSYQSMRARMVAAGTWPTEVPLTHQQAPTPNADTAAADNSEGD